MRARLVVLLGLLLCSCDGAPLTDAGPPTDAGPRVDAGGPPADRDGFIEWQMTAGGVPGLAAAIVRAGGVEWMGAYGMADIATERPVDAHTLFIMASVSKTFAAVRAMQLSEEGALDLDAPVDDAIGRPLRHPDHPNATLSLRWLLSHVSGLEDSFLVLGEATYTTDPPISLGEFTDAYAREGGDLFAEGNWGARPGARHSYCNAGYGVVGHVLEAAGGESLRAQSDRELFAPLALDGAGWFLADVDAARLATPYGFNGRRFEPLPHNGFAYYPASSLRISATGLARWAQMLLRGGELDGARVLSQASVDELLRVQYPRLDDGQALTFFESTFGGRTYIGHSGATFGGSTQLLLSRDLSYAIVVLTNSDAYIRGRVGLPEGRDALRAIIERLGDDVDQL